MTKPKQEELPGMKPKKIKFLEDFFSVYAEKRNEHLALTQELKKAKSDIHSYMKEKEIPAYKYMEATPPFLAIREDGEEEFSITSDAKKKKKKKGDDVEE